MRHRHLLPAAALVAALAATLLLTACSGTPASPMPEAPDSQPPASDSPAPATDAQHPAPQPPTSPEPATPDTPGTPDIRPVVERLDGHVIVRSATGIGQASLSPDGSQMAIIYGAGDSLYPVPGLGLLSLEDGQVREVAQFLITGELQSPLLLGWLDEQHVVVLAAGLKPDGPVAQVSPGVQDGPAVQDSPAQQDAPVLRAEVWDMVSGQRTSASAWVSVAAGHGMGGRPQAWLVGSGDKASGEPPWVALKTRAFWRLDPVGGTAEFLVDDLPAIKNLGSYVYASPDRRHALYGGEMYSGRHGLVDILTGTEIPLPEAWRQLRWGEGGHLLALTSSEAHPGKELRREFDVRFLSSTVLVVGMDGQVQRELVLPDGLLTEKAFETPQGWLVVETFDGPLLTAPPAGAALQPFYDPPEWQRGMPVTWLRVGDWLVAEGRQIPLTGGAELPWPEGIQHLLPGPEGTPQPALPLVVGASATRDLSLFVAGQTVAYPLGRSSSDQKVLQLEMSGEWATVRFYGENGRSEMHLVRMTQ